MTTILAQASGESSGIETIISFIVLIVMVASMWRLFTKAGQPGWAAIIPIYNFIVYIKITGKSLIYLLLVFIPIINIAAWLILLNALVRKFGKGTGYFIISIFFGFITIPMLAFGDAEYDENA